MWGRVAVGSVLAIVGLVLGPVLMAPVYVEMAPCLGAMTLLVVELIFALLIDAPLAGIFVGTLGACGRAPANAAQAAVGFALGFFLLIGACIALSSVSPVFAWLGLSGTFGPAVASSIEVLGLGGQAVLLVCFLTFDLLACAAAGTAAANLVGRSGGSPDASCPRSLPGHVSSAPAGEGPLRRT